MAFVTTDDVKMMSLFCGSCNEIFAIPSRRGRPPKFCNKCTTTGLAEEVEIIETEVTVERQKQISRDRVDRLEMMLMSRGTHLRQQKDKW